MNPDMNTLCHLVTAWADKRNLIHRDNAVRQALKVVEEMGETAGALLKNNEEELVDGLGDTFVTLIILTQQLGYSPHYVLGKAYEVIENRTGKTVNGTFVKD
jgi:NTP pyrophosphatase (non-canonical NTP hydrolase)